MESLLSQRSVDRIRLIEMNLRNQRFVREEGDQPRESKISLDSHPLGIHQSKLLKSIEQLHCREKELQKQLTARQEEDKSLR